MTDVPNRRTEIYREIFAELSGWLDRGWTECTVTSRRVAGYAQMDLVAVDDSGRSEQPHVQGTGLSRQLRALRELMYEPGKGAWFTAVLRFESGGRFSADFDYDNEPAWYDAISPLSYVDEIERFPRDSEHTPDWLRRRLAEANRADG